MLLNHAVITERMEMPFGIHIVCDLEQRNRLRTFYLVTTGSKPQTEAKSRSLLIINN